MGTQLDRTSSKTGSTDLPQNAYNVQQYITSKISKIVKQN